MANIFQVFDAGGKVIGAINATSTTARVIQGIGTVLYAGDALSLAGEVNNRSAANYYGKFMTGGHFNKDLLAASGLILGADANGNIVITSANALEKPVSTATFNFNGVKKQEGSATLEADQAAMGVNSTNATFATVALATEATAPVNEAFALQAAMTPTTEDSEAGKA